MTPEAEAELLERQRQARPAGTPWRSLAGALEDIAERLIGAAAVLRALPLDDPSDELLARVVELELADKAALTGGRSADRRRVEAHDAVMGILFELLGPGWWRTTDETAPAPRRGRR
jgi:hypothetical protein